MALTVNSNLIANNIKRDSDSDRYQNDDMDEFKDDVKDNNDNSMITIGQLIYHIGTNGGQTAWSNPAIGTGFSNPSKVSVRLSSCADNSMAAFGVWRQSDHNGDELETE